MFTKYKELNDILLKVTNTLGFKGLNTITITRTAYRLTDKMHQDHPEAINMLSNGHAYDMSTNIFERLPQIFYDAIPDSNSYARILGRSGNNRVYKYILRKYVNNVKNYDKYKIFLPKANGAGSFGEAISQPIIECPGTGSTETFLSIGVFDTNLEAENTMKYIKTKFLRAMLGVLKTTQDLTPEKFKFVPLLDFTSSSDIDWSASIADIDRQLYKKYGLSKEEIDFVETNVKEMQ